MVRHDQLPLNDLPRRPDPPWPDMVFRNPVMATAGTENWLGTLLELTIQGRARDAACGSAITTAMTKCLFCRLPTRRRR